MTGVLLFETRQVVAEAGQERGEYPGTPRVDEAFVAIQTRKMDAIREAMLGRIDPETAREALQAAGSDEIAYYRGAGKLDDFAKLNEV